MFHCMCASQIRQLFIFTKPLLATSKCPSSCCGQSSGMVSKHHVYLPADTMPTSLCLSVYTGTISISCLWQLDGCLCRINDREAKYYADDEDAYDMRKQLTPWSSSKDDFKAIARRLDTAVKKA